MPKIAEFANHVLDLVAEETEIPKELILSKSRAAEVVDARHLAIKLLYLKGIYPKRIAEIFGMSARSVHYVTSGFNDRIAMDKSLKSSYEALKRRISL